MNYRKLRSLVAVCIALGCCVAIYFVCLLTGIMSAIVLAIFVGPLLSLLIPVTAIRYGIMGAYVGIFAGFVALVCLTLVTWGAIPERSNTLITTACYGGGAIAGIAIGVAIALRRKSKAGPNPR